MELVAEKYKQTELGQIPEDWDVKEFVEVMDGFSSGQTPYRAVPEYYKGDIPWITSGELNYNVITDTIEKITIEGAREANLKMIPKGTFLFAITGLEAAGTRGSCAITGIESTTNQSCMALYPKKGLLITSYLYHYYVRYGNELAFKYCQGTKQQSYTGGIAKKLPIIVPPTIEEQTAIATALSDADALISSLEKLIAKKRNVKQGVMQKLLQPKEGWSHKSLGEVGIISGAGVDKTINEGEVPVRLVNYMDVFRHDFIYSNQLSHWVTTPAYKAQKCAVQKGDIFFTPSSEMRFDIAISAVAMEDIPDAAYSYHLVRLRLFEDWDLNFRTYIFKTKYFIDQAEQVCEGSGKRYVISLPKFRGLKIFIPPTKKEQTEIATILSDMDAEINALETKLEKYRKVKLGMMQNLLTGKIRLI